MVVLQLERLGIRAVSIASVLPLLYLVVPAQCIVLTPNPSLGTSSSFSDGVKNTLNAQNAIEEGLSEMEQALTLSVDNDAQLSAKTGTDSTALSA